VLPVQHGSNAGQWRGTAGQQEPPLPIVPRNIPTHVHPLCVQAQTMTLHLPAFAWTTSAICGQHAVTLRHEWPTCRPHLFSFVAPRSAQGITPAPRYHHRRAITDVCTMPLAYRAVLRPSRAAWRYAGCFTIKKPVFTRYTVVRRACTVRCGSVAFWRLLHAHKTRVLEAKLSSFIRLLHLHNVLGRTTSYYPSTPLPSIKRCGSQTRTHVNKMRPT